MAVVVVCAALLACGLAAGVGWSGRPFEAPPPVDALGAGALARRFVWWCSIVLVAGVAAGVTVIGAGGRLAMRLLAVTAGDDAQGRITEADEVVGEITTGGTIGFVVFFGVFGGLLFGAAYLVLRRFLPAGRWAGPAFAAGLLLVLGTTVEPLRPDNEDFDLVGPGWLAVVVFVALTLAFGLAVVGFAARLSTWLPLLTRDWRTLRRYLLPAVVAGVAFTVTAMLVVVYVVVLVLTRWRGLLPALRSGRFVMVGRVAVGVAALAAAPNALVDLADIATR